MCLIAQVVSPVLCASTALHCFLNFIFLQDFEGQKLAEILQYVILGLFGVSRLLPWQDRHNIRDYS